MHPQTSTNALPLGVLTSAVSNELNKINMDIRGDQVLISGLLDLKGLEMLEKKITGLKTLLDDEDIIG